MSYTIASDIHTHTLFSRHAYSTIAENVAAARRAELEVLGSSDHFSAMLESHLDIRDFQFFINQVAWPRLWDGVILLRAAEVDIVTLDGGLFGEDIGCPESIAGQRRQTERSLFECALANLDYLIASVHNDEFTRGASLARTTQMYVRALEHPRVFELGHVGRSGVPFDLDEVLGCAKALGKLIEVNEHSLARDPDGSSLAACERIACRCAELGVGISVSSDAHIALDIGSFPSASAMLERIDFPEELIMNRSRDSLFAQLCASGVCDLRDIT
ncbi:PHP domain protein [Coriobacterium glomerans PW2]|uniref:PHP domain protein n=1 Tax=Coriobacterium glomerans (strain ATCC 49209 / DSM 20642 / JCM 10262 / PW2) TaxID=700015 RepID=F2N6Y7_CORGP|nr:phosphatase [Coriobacterium glomerans]AEB06186.1 PHP domain protein [Coriobacterium glomerans PW2]